MSGSPTLACQMKPVRRAWSVLMAFACWLVDLTTIVLPTRDAQTGNACSLAGWITTVSLDTCASTMFALSDANKTLIVPHPNHVLATNVLILAPKQLVDKMLNVQLLDNRPSALVNLGSCLTPHPPSDVFESSSRALSATSALQDSNASDRSVNRSAPPMLPANPTSCASTLCVKRFAGQTKTVLPMRFARVSSVSKDVEQTLTARRHCPAMTTNASILARFPFAVSMQFVSHKITKPCAHAHQVLLGTH